MSSKQFDLHLSLSRIPPIERKGSLGSPEYFDNFDGVLVCRACGGATWTEDERFCIKERAHFDCLRKKSA